MAGYVTIEPSRKRFYVDGDDSILEAALRHGIALDYGCSNGNCGMCKARLVSGEVIRTRRHEFVIPEAEKIQGHFLMCSNTVGGDVTVMATEANNVSDIPLQRMTVKIKKIKALTPHIWLLHVQTPRIQRLRFLAGQSARLTLAGGVTDKYPIASCPCDDRNLEFHVRDPGTSGFGELVQSLAQNQNISLEGPVGDFTLNERSHHPAVFLAYDTGFAPIKSLIEHAMQLELSDSLRLYWVAFGDNGHYMHNLARSWSDAFDDFFYTPVSLKHEHKAESDPGEATDAIIDQLRADGLELDKHDFYIAGPAPMPAATQQRLIDAGVAGPQIRCLSTH